jgi:tetratricopeptide (TPR) repeat protein
VTDSARIEELRRRLLRDPASIAFAQLAEEHRRAGDLDEAIRVCRDGLERHPEYLSARVTLGRALLALGQLEEAAGEFSRVVEAAPDNLVALRALSEIHQRTRAAGHARASETPQEPPDVRQTADRIEHQPAPEARQASAGDDVDPVAAFVAEPGGDRVLAGEARPGPSSGPEPPAAGVDPLVTELETWLAVLAERRSA